MEEKDIFGNDLEELNNSNSINETNDEIEPDLKITEEDNINLKQSNNKTKVKDEINKTPKNHTLLYLIIICITVISSVGIFSYSNYQKEQLKQEQENERIEKEQKAVEANQKKLNSCINQAKSNRSNLWKTNCNDPNGKCTISSQSTIDWIEQRYQQDLDNCYQLYGN